MLRSGLSLCLLLTVAACTPDPAPAAPPAAGATAPLEFTATVQLAHDTNGKQFHGVILLGDDGERWVASYQAEPWLVPFAEQRVRVTGERHTPDGQALMLPHLRVHTLALVDPARALTAPFLVSVGREQTLRGTFTDEVGEPGSKLAGEPYRVFTVAGGESYQLVHAPDDVRPGQPQQIFAREVELSPHVARRGGPTLWVLAIQ